MAIITGKAGGGGHVAMTTQEARAESLNALYQGKDASRIIAHAAYDAFPERLAFVSSFGAESAVLLHLMAGVDPGIPVLFLDTHKLFGETARYRSRLQHHLGLEDVRVIGPRKADLEAEDPQGTLSMHDPDKCCDLRKVQPLARALKHFDCWATGRKRHQTAFRKEMEFVEFDGRHFKLNPLAAWTRQQVAAYAAEHKLPPHPLLQHGYHSIGCMPCTSKVIDEDDARSGRWAGQAKTECGIHTPRSKD